MSRKIEVEIFNANETIPDDRRVVIGQTNKSKGLLCFYHDEDSVWLNPMDWKEALDIIEWCEIPEF